MSITDKALSIAITAAQKASQFLKQSFEEQSFTKTIKNDGSPVTSADITAQRIIEDELISAFPEIPIIGEENYQQASQHNSSDLYWFVDPLDGTKEFLKHSEEFTVNIALVKKSRPIVAVISVPVWHTYYYAAKGIGCYKMVESKKEKIHCTERRLTDAVAVQSKDHTSNQQSKVMEHIPVTHTFAAGSSLKGCYLAEGKADLYLRLSPLWYWDVCAQDCIVTEAGGMCTDKLGSMLHYSPEAKKFAAIVLSNNQFHTEIIDSINKA